MKRPKETIERPNGWLINLTPYRVIVERRLSPDEEPEIILDLPPAVKEASFLSNLTRSTITFDDSFAIEVFDTSGSAIVGLPAQSDNRYLIVTPVILEALKGNREDCLAPFIFEPYGSLDKIGGVLTARTVGFLRGSFSQDRDEDVKK